MCVYIKYDEGQIIGNNGIKYIRDCERVGKHRAALFVCSCGNEFKARIDGVKSGVQQGCGCIQRVRASEANTKHGGFGSKLYSCFLLMKARCNNSNNPKYYRYGGRGIKICAEWSDFIAFKEWSLENGYNEGLSIDRIDNNDGYSPSNCRWVTHAENMRNTSVSMIWITPDGVFDALSDVNKFYGKDIGKFFYDDKKEGFTRIKKYENN
jgi:hypothetical protein